MSSRFPPPARYNSRQPSYSSGRFEHDRWDRDRRPDPRAHSPVRRDSRDYVPPRDIDTDRAQRHPREAGPASAGSNISDPPRYGNLPFRGSSYAGRARGRPDWEYRGRSRPFPPDERERDSFRPRSRSRGRHERDRSVDSRDFDRRDDRRDDYRRDDEWHYRRPRPDEREYGRRDPLPRPDLRHSDSAISPAERSRGVSPHRRPSPDLKRDFDPPRRQSTAADLLPPSAARRDIERTDSSSLRPDSTRDRPSTRQSEPDTHSSVAVPQFGSIPSLPLSASVASSKISIIPVSQTSKPSITAKLSPSSSIGTHIEKLKEAPSTSQPLKASPSSSSTTQASKPASQAPIAVSTPPAVQLAHQPKPALTAAPAEQAPDQSNVKLPPTAPRAQLGLINPPTGPKADRITERERLPSIGVESQHLPVKEAKTNPHSSPRPSHTLPPSSTKSEPQFHDAFSPHRPIVIVSPVMAQRLAPPTGPRAGPSQPFSRAASAGPFGRDVSPTQSQTAIAFVSRPNLSHKGLPDNVPTGPKAQRIPPTALRMQKLGGVPRPLTSLQWRAPQPALSRATTVPAKRDANGEEKERTPVPERPGESFSRASTFSVEPKTEITNDASQVVLSRKQSAPSDALSNDILMTDALATRSPEALAFDTDDDGVELNEEDFQEQEARFREKKAELEAQYVDLEDQWRNRISPVIEESDRLRGILDIIGELPLPDLPPQREDLQTEEHFPSPPKEPDSPIATTEAQEDDVLMQDIQETTPPKSRIGSPDLMYLPYFSQRPPTPLSDPDQLAERSDDEVKSMLSSKLQDIEDEQADFQGGLRTEYVSRYREWKQIKDTFEKEKEEADAALAQSKMEIEVPEPPAEPAPPPLPTPTTERRRQHLFTSALDLQRVLEESRKEEEARREKAEREAKEAQASAEREAKVPVMLGNEEIGRRVFKDTSLLRQANEALRVFEYAPPEDTFTEEEDRRLREEYDQGTKMWHKIADAVGRTTKECINHYYATKWDQPYKRQKNKRAKRKQKGAIRKPEAELQVQETTIGLTETGRPRRAAAPTFSSKVEKSKLEDGDTDGQTGKKSLNAKSDSNTAEDKAPRGRKPGKEKPGRKPRTQTITAKAAPSPQKVLKEKKDKLHAVPESAGMIVPPPPPLSFTSERVVPAMIPQQPLFADPTHAIFQNKPDLAPTMSALPPSSIPLPVTERPRSHSQSQRQGPSSYWSVPEEAEFKECLKYYGTDFNAIANHMGKKTPVMIKNHFQKYRHDEFKNADVLNGAALADQKRERGELLGPMPPNLRKRPEHILSTPSRSGIPSSEMMETDSPPSGGPLHGSPRFHPQGRLHLLQQQVTSGPQGYSSQGVPAPGVPPKPTRLEFFSSDVSPIESHVQPQPQVHMSPTMGGMQDAIRQPKQQSGRIKTEYEPRTVNPPRRDQEPSQTPLQAAMQSAVQNAPEHQIASQRMADQDRLPAGINAYQTVSQLNLGPNISVRPLLPEGSVGQAPVPPTRQFVDLTAAPSIPKPSIEQLARPIRPHSPSLQIYPPSGMYQPPSTVPPPPQTVTPRPQSTPSNPPAPPSRKVNIMSMLNPEPAEEEKPRKKEQGRALPPTQPSHIPIADQYVSQQDPYRDSSRHGHRPMYSTSHLPAAVSEGPGIGAPRDWTNRQSYIHAPPGLPQGHADSPRLQTQPISQNPIDLRGNRDFRAVTLGGLNNPHGVPSPPPGPYVHGHSRTSSYSAQGAPLPVSGPGGPPPMEAYAPGPRGAYPPLPPHSSAPPSQPRGAPIHSSHPYPISYGESSITPGGPMDPRSRDMGMLSGSVSYRREYEVPPSGRDPRDLQGHPPPMYQQGGHASPQPTQDHRYAPPPPPPRSTHTPLGQGYPSYEAPRGYEGGPPPEHRDRDPRDPSHWYHRTR